MWARTDLWEPWASNRRATWPGLKPAPPAERATLCTSLLGLYRTSADAGGAG